jgi:predicted NAD-dependent protein-ADP-ribosyltransferase YbiA (DUF1768 family)
MGTTKSEEISARKRASLLTILRLKFKQCAAQRQVLLETGNTLLVEFDKGAARVRGTSGASQVPPFQNNGVREEET